MELSEFSKMMEKQLHESPQDLFDKSDLNDEEKNIFIKHLNYCEYWLLRIKVLYYQSINKGELSYLKSITRVLINLDSNKVSGPKPKFLKEMFSDKKIHKIKKTKSGVRSTQNSPKVDTAYFELKIMSFFLQNNYICILPEVANEGIRIPEFKVRKDKLSLNIEAKCLDNDATLDHIFGDVFIKGIDHRMSELEKDKGHIGIRNQFSRNYEDAVAKYRHIPKDEYYLIIIYIDELGFNSKYLVDFINQLPEQWAEKEYNRLVGLIITSGGNTHSIMNTNCKEEVLREIKNNSIDQFHKYIPEVIMGN